jgi:membrane protease YdiL (CAAX protease family)
MVLYPLLSAFPQEAIYRAFLFHRYAPILKTGHARTWASVLAFSFLHIVFGNWVAVALTLPAGWIFARTYRTTGSLALASLEHAVYGCIVFTVGLGRFFYTPG